MRTPCIAPFNFCIASLLIIQGFKAASNPSQVVERQVGFRQMFVTMIPIMLKYGYDLIPVQNAVAQLSGRSYVLGSALIRLIKEKL
jgi:hypothetical protein